MSEQDISPGDNTDSDLSQFRFIELTSYILFGLGPLVGNAVLTLLGAVSSEFLVDPTTVLIALPAFMFPFAAIQLFSGAISDVYGRVQVIVSGLVAFIVGLFLIAFSTSIEMFALGHIVAGMGFGFVNPVLLALLSDCAVPEDIPKKMGIAFAGASLGVGLGPFVASQMVVLGWQYYYLGILVMIFFGLIAISVANRPQRRTQEESGIKVLINNLSIELRKSTVLLMLATTFLVAFSYLGAMVWTSRGLTGVVDETTIGFLLLGAGICGTVAGISLGRVIRVRGYGFSMVLGIVPLFTSIFLFISISDITLVSSLPMVALALALVGWAGGILFPLMITYSQVISPERRGVLAGLVTASSFFGVALIPSVYEPLFHLGMTTLYLGILGVSVLLLIFISILFRKLELPE